MNNIEPQNKGLAYIADEAVEKDMLLNVRIIPFSDEIDKYLKADDVIDYENEEITQLADTLFQNASNELDFIKMAYEFVLRNHICLRLCYVANPFLQDFVIKS